MPSQESIIAFQKGLQILASVEDYLSLKNTILNLMTISEMQDEAIAKDAIASVLRKKQAVDLQKYKHYPKELEAIDQKYKDLSTVLQNAKATQPNTTIKALPGSNSGLGDGAMSIISKLGSTAVIEFITKNKVFSLGSAVALAGGSYVVYKKFFESKKESNPTISERESNFEKTIRSIQKYRAFSQLSKDPDFDGNYLEIFQGKEPKKKKAGPSKKKTSEDISTQWDREERSLMQNMDVSFNEIAIRPRIEFEMPQLPAPKNINPNEIIGSATPVEIPVETVKRDRKPKNRKEEKSEEKSRKPAPAQSLGRLVPIVKRTKRIKKIEA